MAEAPDNRTASPSPLLTWGRLLRVPNLFTVPGDPIAGYLLASGGLLGWNVLGAVAASMCLYCGGLLLNDYFDRKVDARERPERPIPSGAVRPSTVLAVGGLLLVVGPTVACAAGGPVAGVIAALTALAVYAYDAGLKKVTLLGAAVMGACRAGSVAVGAATATGGVFWGSHVEACLVVMWGYILAVSLLAAQETRRAKMGLEAFGPPAFLFCTGAVMMIEVVVSAFFPLLPWPEAAWIHVLAALVVAVAVGRITLAAVRARRGELPVPGYIGQLIRALIPAQAAWSLWSRRLAPDVPVIVGLLLFYCLLILGAELSSRRFYGS